VVNHYIWWAAHPHPPSLVLLRREQGGAVVPDAVRHSSVWPTGDAGRAAVNARAVADIVSAGAYVPGRHTSRRTTHTLTDPLAVLLCAGRQTCSVLRSWCRTPALWRRSSSWCCRWVVQTHARLKYVVRSRHIPDPAGPVQLCVALSLPRRLRTPWSASWSVVRQLRATPCQSSRRCCRLM
jgi:hypothetical protein